MSWDKKEVIRRLKTLTDKEFGELEERMGSYAGEQEDYPDPDGLDKYEAVAESLVSWDWFNDVSISMFRNLFKESEED